MKGIEIQIKAIKPYSSWLAGSVHPVTVNMHNSVVVPLAGVSDSVCGSFLNKDNSYILKTHMYIQAQC